MTTAVTKEYILPIVGAGYRPPASEILQTLAVGTPLELEAEPDNEHDPNAIAVWIFTIEIPSQSFVSLDDGRLKRHNMTIGDLAARNSWQLGYIPAPIAKTLRQERNFPTSTVVRGSFAVGKNGGAQVKFHLEVEEKVL